MSKKKSNRTVLEDRPEAQAVLPGEETSTLESLQPEANGALHPQDSVERAGQRMRAHDAEEWPVAEDRKLVGMVDEHDPDWQAGGHGHDPKTLKVGEIMSKDLVFCYEDEDCANAHLLMETRGLSHLPVVDRNMRIVGIFSRAEVTAAAN